jgi:hypothetical protein
MSARRIAQELAARVYTSSNAAKSTPGFSNDGRSGESAGSKLRKHSKSELGEEKSEVNAEHACLVSLDAVRLVLELAAAIIDAAKAEGECGSCEKIAALSPLPGTSPRSCARDSCMGDCCPSASLRFV